MMTIMLNSNDNSSFSKDENDANDNDLSKDSKYDGGDNNNDNNILLFKISKIVDSI